MSSELTPEVLSEARAALLSWFDRSRRDLPWRSAPDENPDPYRVWLSEVMLQQTRVETVRPYYERWLERFPDLRTLANADQDEVLKEWEGLGYYSRARNLHRAVREVVDRYGGEVPGDLETFRTLPGVGRYTAGAVMSIAFSREEPVVDGNVRRVFSRLLDLPEPSGTDLWSLAASLVRGERPGDLNQALMELGATLCSPRSAACGDCPIGRMCRANAAGTVASRPARKVATAIPTEHHGVAVVRSGETVLMVRRPERGRLGGMWEFPGAARAGAESAAEAARRAALEWAGATVEIGDAMPPVTHTFTHVRVVYQPYLARIDGRPSLPDGAIWLRLLDLGTLALPRAQRRIAGQLPLDGLRGYESRQ